MQESQSETTPQMSYRERLLTGVWLGLLLTALFMGLNYIVQEVAGIPFLAYAFYDWLARVLPGDIITFTIEHMVDIISALKIGPTSEVADTSKHILSILTLWGVGVVLGGIYGATHRINSPQKGALVALIPLLPVLALAAWASRDNGELALSVLWFILTVLAWGAALVYLLQATESYPATFDAADSSGGLMTRRIFLRNTSVRLTALAVGAAGIGGIISAFVVENARAGKALVESGARRMTQRKLDDGFKTAPGTRPEITPVDDFYTIDISLRPTNVDAESWTLTIDGAVDNPLEFGYDEFIQMEAIEQYATLECISNKVGGDLIGNTRWTGVRMTTLLDMAGVQPDTVELRFYCRDGYYESLPLEDAMREETLLCYGMDGKTLEVDHGFPIRLYVPGRFGMKNPKWIDRIEAIREPINGFWTDKGWTKTAYMKTTSVIDPIEAEVRDGVLAVGGIAFTGDKGVSKVEVRVDDGDWIEATLREPLSLFTWVHWRADLPAPGGGEHELSVRCYEADGTVQTDDVVNSHPDGASGYHSRSFSL